MPREIRLNAFEMATPGHISQGLWTHPRDQLTRYGELAYWTEYARSLEQGLFDGIFFADVLGVYDVFGGSPDAAIKAGVQVPLLDPSLLIPAMASVTTHLGFGVTASLSNEQPFVFARRMSSLDQLTNGRIAWNIVTGYLDSAARAIGMSGQMAHDDRYDLADEYMALVTKLWEDSWDDDAVLADKASGVYADPAKVRAIHHAGPQYRVDAMHLVAPTPQRTPLLFQAGASTRGRRFAATHAECVFVNGQKPDAIDALVTDIRAQAEALGRGTDAIKVFLGATIVTGRTDKEARDKLEDYRRHVDIEAALAHASASMGIDLAKYDLDAPIETGQTQAIVSNVEAMTRAAGPQWTKRKLIDQLILGSRQAPMVGSAETIADQLIGWSENHGIDGFNLSRTVVPECFGDVAELVVPLLQERGAYKTAYAPGTYREKLFGYARLPARHGAARSSEG